jgi:hypothetical protein
MDEIIGGWRKLHSEEIHNIVTKYNVMGRACSLHGKEKRKNAYKVLVGKMEGKRPLGRPRHIGG